MSIFGQEPWALSRDDLDLILEVVSARAEQMRATMEFERRYDHDPSERLAPAEVETWNRLEARVTDARDNVSGVEEREATAEAQPERVVPVPGRLLSSEVADELYAALTMNSLPGLPPANHLGLEPDDWSQSPPAVDPEQPGHSIDD